MIMCNAPPLQIALSRENPHYRGRIAHNRPLDIQPGVTVSDHRALQWLCRDRGWLPVVDADVAGGADHEGLASPFCHDLYPFGLRLARLAEV